MSNAVDNTEACLANIERHNDATNAYITVMADQALEQAAAIDAAAARGEWGGLLAGLPISVKDCGSFEFRVGYAACGLIRVKSSFPAMRKSTVRMVANLV